MVINGTFIVVFIFFFFSSLAAFSVPVSPATTNLPRRFVTNIIVLLLSWRFFLWVARIQKLKGLTKYH